MLTTTSSKSLTNRLFPASSSLTKKIIGPNFRKYGIIAPVTSNGVNSLTGLMNMSFTIEFADGTVHKLIEPSFEIGGVMVGDRTYSLIGQIGIIDEVTW